MADQIPDQVPSLNIDHGGLGGLTVTSPPQVEAGVGDELPPEPVLNEWQVPELSIQHPEAEAAPQVEPRKFDVHANLADAMVLVGDIYNQAGTLSEALAGHIRNATAQPELHGVLTRLQNLLGEFRHAVDQIESSFSEELSLKIADSVGV
jgi:hypothetical protein